MKVAERVRLTLNPKKVPCCHLLVPTQQWNYQNNGWNPNSKDARMRHWCRSVFIDNFKHISHIVLIFSLLALNE